MKASIAVLPLFLAMCSAGGFAQAVKPSITIGTHVLTLGMPESTVLEQVGNDLTLRHLPPGSKQGDETNPPDSIWLVEEKTGNRFVLLGEVSFTAHKLSSVSRNWEIEISSAKSLFYAIDAASKSLEQEGFTNCQLSTVDRDYTVENGSISTRDVELDCGMKGTSISLSSSDAPDTVPTSASVMEWLHSK
ncbi:MAG TPA: hypothetical protein VMW15_09950 [Terracidiphilus sp.]|nr:hypothetical protein [Terracidiphilus sp.]